MEVSLCTQIIGTCFGQTCDNMTKLIVNKTEILFAPLFGTSTLNSNCICLDVFLRLQFNNTKQEMTHMATNKITFPVKCPASSTHSFI
jgi:hypothetical protein